MAEQTPPGATAIDGGPPQSGGRQRAGDRLEEFLTQEALRATAPPSAPSTLPTAKRPASPSPDQHSKQQKSSSSSAEAADHSPQGSAAAAAAAAAGSAAAGSAAGASSGAGAANQRTPIHLAREKFRKHVDQDIVNIIISKHLNNYLSAQTVEFFPPEDGEGKLSNLVLLTAPTQNGKTKEMLALAWKAYFCHGMPSYIFLRSDATAYSDIRDAVTGFNVALERFLDSDEELQKHYHFLNHHYLLALSTLDTQKGIGAVYENKAYKPIVRCRLLIASNVQTAMDSEREIATLVEHFGFTSDGKRLNIMVFVDESQNTRQSQGGDTYGLERSLFHKKISSHSPLLKAAKAFCATHKLPASLVDAICGKSIRELAALYVEVTATPEPTFIMESTRAAQVIQCEIHPNYYGYLAELADDRQIKIKDLSALPGVSWTGLDEPNLIVDSCKAFTENSRGKFEHIIVYHGLRSNNDMDNVAKAITRTLDALERPVVVLCAYGRNGAYGSAIYFNKFGADHIAPHILAAEQNLFLSKAGLAQLQEDFPGHYEFEGLPKNGQFIPRMSKIKETKDDQDKGKDDEDDEDDEDNEDKGQDDKELPFYIMLKEGLTATGKFKQSEDKRSFRFPPKMLYRLRAQLTIVNEAYKIDKKAREGAGLASGAQGQEGGSSATELEGGGGGVTKGATSQLFVVTLGKLLLREGLTIKTWDHDLPPTKQICTVRPDLLKKKPAVDLVQSLGRLCGQRFEPYMEAPVLYVNGSGARDLFASIVNFNSDLSKHVRTKLALRPSISLGEACSGISVPDAINQLVRKKVQGDYLAQELFDDDDDDKERLVQLRGVLRQQFKKQEQAMLYRMFKYLRDPANSYAEADEEPTDFIDFPTLKSALQENAPFTSKDETLFNKVEKKLVELAQNVEDEFAPIIEFERDELWCSYDCCASILVIRDYDGEKGPGNWGICLTWNFMNGLNSA